MKTCPYCCEEIANNTKKCKYCGEEIKKQDVKVEIDYEEENEDNENLDEKYTNVAKNLLGLGMDAQIESIIEQKEKETKFGALLKGFDYLGWIIVIRGIVIVFKGYSTSSGLWRFIMGCYLIFRTYSVAKSICKNVTATKNINKLLRTILKTKNMLRNNENYEDILDELDFSKILKK